VDTPDLQHGTLVVKNERWWYGNKRSGGFSVYVDHRSIGKAPVDGTASTELAPGSHLVRIRGMWLFSEQVKVDIEPGGVVTLRADIPRELSLARRMLKGLISPQSALVLTPI
jgi:hypothetical protein